MLQLKNVEEAGEREEDGGGHYQEEAFAALPSIQLSVDHLFLVPI